MKRFGHTRRGKIIFGFSSSISAIISLTAAFVCQKYIVVRNPIDSLQSIVYLPAIIFIFTFLIFYHGIKALICWHAVLTLKKMGEHVSFREMWRHTIDL